MDWPELRGLAETPAGRLARIRAPIRGCPRSTMRSSRLSWPGAREEIESEMGAPCRSLAYPYGALDPRVAAPRVRSGYEAAGGLLPGPVSARDALRAPRISVGRGWADETLRRRARPWFRLLQASRVWPAVPRLVSLEQRLRGIGRG